MKQLLFAIALIFAATSVTIAQTYPRLTSGTEQTHATITVGSRYSVVTYKAGGYSLVYDKTGFRLNTPTRTVRVSHSQGFTTANKFWAIVYSNRTVSNQQQAISLLKSIDR